MAAVVLLYGRKKESKPESDNTQKLIAKVRLTQIRYFIAKVFLPGLSAFEFLFSMLKPSVVLLKTWQVDIPSMTQ
jgi:hypothetical protein